MGECMKPRWRQWLSTLKDFILETLKLMAIALLLIACTGVLLGVRDNGLFEFVGYSTMFMAAICNHLRVLLAPRPIRLGDPLSVGATTHIILPYTVSLVLWRFSLRLAFPSRAMTQSSKHSHFTTR